MYPRTKQPQPGAILGNLARRMSSPPSDGTPSSVALRYSAWITRHAGKILAACLAIGAAATAVASRLELRTAVHELLPHKDPGVVALLKTQERLGNLTLLLVGVRSPDPAANERFAEALTQRMRALPPSVLAFATYHVRDLKGFFESNKWLYLSETDLEDVRDQLRREITKRKNPLLVDLSDDSESPEALEKRIAGRKDQLGGRFPNGLFASPDGKYLWIAALPPGDIFVEKGGEGLLEAAQKLAAEVDPKKFHAEMVVDVAGPIQTAIATRQAVERDILWVTATCLVIVALSIGLYFRRLRAVPLIGVPAVIGTVVAFATAELAFGYLNSSTAFLGSIILGNGINYAIILMSRYEQERGGGRTAEVAIAAALDGTVRGTGVAAICASVTYASLMLTSFRGFFQFGVMGAAGVAACWVMTFLMLPAFLAVLDRRGHTAQVRPPLGLGVLGRVLVARPGTVLIASMLVTGVALFGLQHFLQAPFEYDFRKLSSKLDNSEDHKQFNQSLDKLFGRWPFPTVILADRPEDVEPIRASVRKQDAEVPGADSVGQIVTINDVLPGTPEQQARKLEILAEIRKLVHDPAVAVLDEADRKKLQQLDPPTTLRVLEGKDLPAIARRPFTEVDGTVGRVVLVYPPEKNFSVWNGRDLLRMADAIQHVKLDDGRVIETSGNAVVFSAMLRSILRDGPLATVASLTAVMVLLFLIMRPLWSAAASGITLILGVIWMVGAAGLARVSITFLNFIALPITFGIGLEYAVNVLARYRERRDMVEAVSSTGGAVALCSWTTIVGYGSLLAARNQALQGFGQMAILGEVACLLAAVLALPAFFLWRSQRKGGQKATPMAAQ